MYFILKFVKRVYCEKIEKAWRWFSPTSYLQKKDNDLNEGGDSRWFHNRIVVFIVVLAHKCFLSSFLSFLIILIDIVIRTRFKDAISSWHNYVVFLQAVFFLFVFVHKLVTAWLKSGKCSLLADYKALTTDVIKFVVTLLMSAINLVVVYIVTIRFVYPKLVDRGLLGDSFGTLNSLLSTGALIGAWITIWLQHRQIVEDKRQCLKNEQKENALRKQEILTRRRAVCPVVVASSLEGFVKVFMWLPKNNEEADVLLGFDVDIDCMNCSDDVLLNVVKIVAIAEGDRILSANPSDNCTPYILGKDKFKVSIPSMFFSMSVKDLIKMLRGDLELVLSFKIVFSTSQQFSYLMQEEYKMRIDLIQSRSAIVSKLLAEIEASNRDKYLNRGQKIRLSFVRNSLKFKLRDIEGKESLMYLKGVK